MARTMRPILTALILLGSTAAVFAQEDIEPESECLVPGALDLSERIDLIQKAIKDDDFKGASELVAAMRVQFTEGLYETGDGRRCLPFAHALAMRLSGLQGAQDLIKVEVAEAAAVDVRTLPQGTLRGLLADFPFAAASRSAADELASRSLDAGRPAEAARLWQVLDRFDPDAPEAAQRLLKQAFAWRLCGVNAPAAQAAAALKKRFPDARGRWQGQDVVLARVVEKVLEVVPAAPADAADFAAAPDGPLSVLWQVSPGVDGTKADLRKLLAAESIIHQYPHLEHTAHEAKIVNGRLTVTHKPFGGAARQTSKNAPALLHPVVAGSRVWARTDSGILSWDLQTGKATAGAELPLRRKLPTSVFGITWLCDEGLYRVTAAGDRLYGLTDLLPVRMLQIAARPGDNRPIPPQWRDSSALVCVDAEGKELWRAGHGLEVEDSFMNSAKFAAVPAVSDGRVYSIAILPTGVAEVVCLDAAKGGLLWRSPLQLVPARSTAGPVNRYMWDACSRPVVADGKVFATANAGVLAAFDAATGRRLWAVQYPSRLFRHVRGSWWVDVAAGRTFPVNPLLVRDGMLIALPTDSDDVLALNVFDGSSLWSAPRRDGHWLSLLPGRRLLISSPGLTILNARNGEQIQSLPAQGFHGQPAVTKNAILISSPQDGGIVAVDLESLKKVTVAETPEGGLLGNLIVTGSRIIAANAAGITGYGPQAEPPQP